MKSQQVKRGFRRIAMVPLVLGLFFACSLLSYAAYLAAIGPVATCPTHAADVALPRRQPESPGALLSRACAAKIGNTKPNRFEQFDPAIVEAVNRAYATYHDALSITLWSAFACGGGGAILAAILETVGWIVRGFMRD